MIYLHFIFLVFLFTTALGSTKEDHSHFKTSSNQRKVSPTEFVEGFTTISHITDYYSSLNISEVSTTNNPDDYLVMYYNISVEIMIPGLFRWSVSAEKSDVRSPYSDERKEIRRNMETTNEEAGVDFSITTIDSIWSKVDFSNMDTRSRIEYNLTIVINTNVTWNSEFLNSIERSLPTINDNKYLGSSDYPAFVPLVNTTGHDNAICQNQICSSSTETQELVDSYNMFDKVSLYNQKIISSTVGSTTYSNDVNTTFSMLSKIHLQYVVVIGEERCV
ncbi:uncharacterized protein LOC130448648 isoform X2 [Diorhabda sublineata]|uniref:uncharacterized protein LOC130448648 isoform X2 n=1 Tax=Diorhabda sublineata TaxID=1163346 RepID=UPI0024E0E363|nr:uncharacterized protein LOC130448648 isoform X2 [Diorhabda sublineata]